MAWKRKLSRTRSTAETYAGVSISPMMSLLGGQVKNS
jgi:hypothetical protein